jgi:hypothetical protein
MFDGQVSGRAAALLQQLHAVLDELTTLPLPGESESELLALWREVEGCRRRFAPLDHALISEVRARQLAPALGAKTLTVLARDVLRIGAGEARARIAAADALGVRRSVTGEVLAPVYPRVAAAQASGSIGEAAAKVITGMIDRLPDTVRCEQDLACEALLVEQAQILDVDALKQVAQRLDATINPDGVYSDVAYRRKHRCLRLQVRPDGSSHGQFEGTAEFTEWLRTVLDSTARPVPEQDGVKDARTVGQRQHDGLLDAFKLLARAELLPAAGGLTTTVMLTMSEQAAATGQGTATTGHGIVLPAREALLWLDGGTQLIPIVLNQIGAITGIGTGHRLFTPRQRLAMTARDGGCCFPGCQAPPQWTEAHHVIEHRNGGPTTVTNGCLLCGFHHREFERMGWRVDMTDGLPTWTPPAWIDPEQKPIRNRRHDPMLRT